MVKLFSVNFSLNNSFLRYRFALKEKNFIEFKQEKKENIKGKAHKLTLA